MRPPPIPPTEPPDRVTSFLASHTTLDDEAVPLLDECPICLDNYSSEPRLRIANLPNCAHHVGASCLSTLLRTRPDEEKKCPLCRTVWIPAGPAQSRDRSEVVAEHAERRRRAEELLAEYRSRIDTHVVNHVMPRAAPQLPSPIRHADTKSVPRPRRDEPVVIDLSRDAGEDYESLTRDIETVRARARASERGARKRRGGGGADVGDETQASAGAENGRARDRAAEAGGSDVPGGDTSAGYGMGRSLGGIGDAVNMDRYQLSRRELETGAPIAARQRQGFQQAEASRGWNLDNNPFSREGDSIPLPMPVPWYTSTNQDSVASLSGHGFHQNTRRRELDERERVLRMRLTSLDRREEAVRLREIAVLRREQQVEGNIVRMREQNMKMLEALRSQQMDLSDI
ncbi:hypothetical protein ACN47E_004245 [Coniothyrium glycines]